MSSIPASTMRMMLLGTVLAFGCAGSAAQAQQSDGGMAMEDMGAMNSHMHFTELHPPQPGDQERAARLLATVRQVVAPYRDVHRAEADGFKPNLPQLVRRHYHFSRPLNFVAALFGFDPARPTSLLYDRDPDGTFHLTGVMYTAPRTATMAKLNARVPLSVGRWHEHLNLCLAPRGDEQAYLDKNPVFGDSGSIATAAACSAAGGRFMPQLLGWMVHIYPYEDAPQKVWATDRDMD